MSVALLVITSPVLAVAMLLVGRRQRSGFITAAHRLARELFSGFRLRTMSVAPHNSKAVWTVPGDRRITRVSILRHLRLDELPQ